MSWKNVIISTGVQDIPFNTTGEEEDATKETYKHFLIMTNVSKHSIRLVKQRQVSRADKDLTRFTG